MATGDALVVNVEEMFAIGQHGWHIRIAAFRLPDQVGLGLLPLAYHFDGDRVPRTAAVATVDNDHVLTDDRRCNRPQRHAVESPFILPVPSAGGGPIAGDPAGAGHDQLRLFPLSFHEQG